MSTVANLKELTPEAKLSEIIAVNNGAKELLASIGLKPLEHQDETLRSVCQQQKWSEVEVLEWVKKHSSSWGENSQEDTNKIAPDSTDVLSYWVDYLADQFLNPINNLLKEINANFPRVYKIHANQYPWLKNMQWHYEKFREGLRMYYKFEDEKFLPMTKKLASSRSATITHGTIRQLEKCFVIVEKDQERLSRVLNRVRRKGNNFENPDLACSTLCIMNENFKRLQEHLGEQFDFEAKQLIPKIKRELRDKS